MINLYDEQMIQKLEKISSIFNIIVGVIGFSVLIGWYFDIGVLKSIFPDFIAMKPNAAISFILISICFAIQKDEIRDKKSVRFFIAKLLALIIFLIALLTLIENIFGFDFHIDQLLFHEAPGPTVFYAPGRMAPIASFTLFLIGLNLLLWDNKSLILLQQIIAVLIGLFGAAVLVGIAFHGESHTYLVHYFYAAVHAAFNFILISLAFLFARPIRGLMQIITNNTAGGESTRRLIPFVIITPIILAYLTSHGIYKDLFDATSAVVFFAMSNIVVLLTILFWIGRALMRTDIERKKAYNKLKKANEELEYSNNELHQIIRVVAHDLQEPLRIISNFTQLLAKRYKDKIDADANDFINFAVDGAKRMQNQLNDMLTFTHVEADLESVQLTDCNVLLKNALNELKQEIISTNAKITNDILPILKINPKQITSVFYRLLGNAIKFRQELPKIHVFAHEEPTEWVFSIQDNGIGIDPKYQEQIFILFKSLHTKDKYTGTGIGLPICKKIIGFHHGKMWVKSELGKGSTFYFSIPK